MRGRGRAGNGNHAWLRSYGSPQPIADDDAPRGAVTDLYQRGIREARRVLRDKGSLIVKVADEVLAGRQWLTHVAVVNFSTALGFEVVDLFHLIRRHGLAVSGQWQQRHSRKNVSYFVVLRKLSTRG